jgi:hypothetical protein
MQPGEQMKNIQRQIKEYFHAGELFEKDGEYRQAFTMYRAGNNLQMRLLEWDEPQEVENLQDLTKTFQNYNNPTDQGVTSNVTPIFILGMPRSGSTLIEQVLSMHPDIHAAGELSLLSDITGRHIERFEPGQDYRKIALQYLNELGKICQGKRFVTDKMPANFFFIGLIRQVMPHAKIIHTERHPLDTCVSCYAKLFNMGNLAFTYDLGYLARYYMRYQALMGHWYMGRDDDILSVEYESVVADLEGQARRMLDFIGLPWDHACMDFYKSSRAVKTASKSQVTKPIYTSSIGRWRHYREFLGPLQPLTMRQIGRHEQAKIPELHA